MNSALKRGFSFGLTSGIITTLGLLIGLNSSTHSKMVVLAGILTIAIADSLSDAFGMHMSEETDKRSTEKSVIQVSYATFLFKFLFAISFIVPILVFDLDLAIVVSIIWGILLIALASRKIAKDRNESVAKVETTHIFITIIVIVLSHFAGVLINYLFS